VVSVTGQVLPLPHPQFNNNTGKAYSDLLTVASNSHHTCFRAGSRRNSSEPIKKMNGNA